ncbi:hypothetical protein AMEX_G20631 [Astyanax mexicanus]|uniref:Vitelline membrane outer layer 1 homolog b n=2 Tax=Astyanax mexicanus TaxID=7994 RepID=A0A8T2LA23_ASTMX|nr:hypothetical protein AMEX_G20631 [Astyanax mexicanus]
MQQLVYLTVTLLLVCFGCYTEGQRPIKSTLTVPNGAPWGEWAQKEMCPKGYYAAGFSLKVEYPVDGDDTALNGIRLHCVNSAKGRSQYSSYRTVTSGTGSWGTWTNIKWCWSGLMKNFQLRVEPPQGNGDDTAVNNVRFQCTAGGEITGEGTSWGDWGGWSKWCSATGICGIQTKIEGSQGSGDDTSLNDVRFFCCD